MRIHTEIDIDAPAERVWDILTDFDAYADWNPMIPRLRGQLDVGSRLDFHIKLNRRVKVPISVELVCADAPYELRWVGPSFSPLRRLVNGSHYFRIEPIDDDHCFFRHGEDFEGLAVPSRWHSAETRLTPLYAALNRALKRRAEA